MATERAASLRKFLREAYARATVTGEAEKERHAEGGRHWDIYETPLKRSARRYERAFQLVLDETFGTLFERRRAQKGKIFAMDVMGTGGYDSYGVDGEAAITLADLRDENRKAEETGNNKLVTEGDVLRRGTWLPAEKHIKKHDDTKFQGYDLLSCRPEGGWKVIEGAPDYVNASEQAENMRMAAWMITHRMFRLTSPHGGISLIQLPFHLTYSPWYSQLNQVPGVEAVGDEYWLKLTKTGNPKGLLPKIPAPGVADGT